MTLPYFSSYLGILLMLSVVCAVIAKNLADGLAGKGKKPYVYGGLSSVLASAVAWGIGFVTNNLFLVFWLLSGLFLIFGMLHQYFVKTKYFYALHHNSSKVFWGEVFFGLSMVAFTLGVFSALQYFLRGEKEYLFFPMVMSSLFFFVPMLFQNMYKAAVSIPEPQYHSWPYPLHSNLTVPDEDPSERVLVIGFEMLKNKAQGKPTYFRAKAPEHIKLGHLFYFFINDYNELNSETPIRVTTESNEPEHWLFYKKKKWFQPRKMYNPERNFRENGIVENTVIIAKRI